MTNLPTKILLILIASGLILTASTATVFSQTNLALDPNCRVIIDGAVTNPLNLTLADLAAMPQVETHASLYCEGVLVAVGNWQGVLLQSLINQAGIKPDATTIEFYASDEYNINVAVPAVAQQDLIIAYALDGVPITDALRLVLPSHPGNYWISKITEIKVTYSSDVDVVEQIIGNVILPPPAKPTMMPTPSTAPTAPTQTTAPPPTFEPTQTPTPLSTEIATTQPTIPLTPKPVATSTSTLPSSSPPTSSTTQDLTDQQQQPTPTPIQNTISNAFYVVLAVVVVVAAFAGLAIVRYTKRTGDRL